MPNHTYTLSCAVIVNKKDMKKLCIIVGIIVFGWIGWWIGAKIGFTTAYILSTLASMAGVYAGWRIYRDYLS
jgi:hypothetical protein